MVLNSEFPNLKIAEIRPFWDDSLQSDEHSGDAAK